MGDSRRRPRSADERPLVLFIEDNPMQRDLYAMVIEEELDVCTATHLETGYRLALSKDPDVVVVDVLLPDGDGLALCARLKAHPDTAATPVVVLTGDDAALARAQLAPGVHAILSKPCPADKLLDTLRSAVQSTQ